MSDVSAGADHPHLPSTSSSTSAATASVTRILQHAILQLCNEHVSYDHTLQVLGVVCVTVDDRPSELIVKLNNTLKRVDALATQSDDRRGSAVRAASSRSMSQSWQRGGGAPAGSSEAVSSCSGSAVGPSSEASSGTSRADGQTSDAETSLAVRACSTPVHADNETSLAVTPGPASSESGSRRKCHGRKQSKPVRVQNIVEEDPVDDDDDDEGELTSELGSGILVISPDDLSETPSAANSPISIRASCSERSSPMTPINTAANCHTATSSKRSLAETFGSMHPSRRTPTPGSTSTVRALLTGMYAKNTTVEKQPGLRPSTAESPSLKFVPDLKLDGRASSLSAVHGVSNGIEMHDGSLNFSRYALERPSSDSRVGRNSAEHPSGSTTDVKVKEEFLQNPLFPNLDYLMRAPTTATAPNGVGAIPFDISQSLPAFAPFIDESQLMSIARLDPHQFALYSTLFASNGCAQIPGLNLPLNINGINSPIVSSPVNMSHMNPQNGADAPGAPATNQPPSSSARYTVSSRLNDGLTMHLSRHHPPVRRRDRFRRRSGGPGSTSAKVKDIIMYDESSPVQTQRGSRIEGDFMLDALHVDGKKRRRRTAEDTLTPEEIAEYMGSSGEGANAGAGQFACRYCGDVSVDLSRYFAHTLTSHGAYVCHQCGKSFTTKSSLLRHRPIHTGMRRFACSICHKSFYRKDKCKAHIKRHLGIPEGSSNPGGVRPPAVGTPVIDPALFSAGHLNVAV